jgi:hypothetical protein
MRIHGWFQCSSHEPRERYAHRGSEFLVKKLAIRNRFERARIVQTGELAF